MATNHDSGFELIASGLEYPESPVYAPDGSILLVEIRGERLTRVKPDGSVETVAKIEGGPNGAAYGPDGHIYVANNGGFEWLDIPIPPADQTLSIGTVQSKDYAGGRIERVDLESGNVETLFTQFDHGYDNTGFGPREPRPRSYPKPVPLKGPDDLVFDEEGGYWITDFGKQRTRDADVTGVYYARGDRIAEMVFPLVSPNGISLSPDGKRLYVAQTYGRQVMYWKLSAAGKIKPNPKTMDGAYLLTASLPGQGILDSMATDEEGNVYVVTMLPEGNTPTSNGGIAIISPKGEVLDFLEIHVDGKFAPLPSSLCFGGPDRKTMYVTCGASGLLLKRRADVAGQALHFNPYS